MPRLIGYARISSPGQDLELQIKTLRKAGCSRVYKETSRGTILARPELQKAIRILHRGDVLVVTHLDRLTRDVSHFMELKQRVEGRGASLISLSDPKTDEHRNAADMFQMFSMMMAQMESGLIRTRTKAGQENARENGIHIGRPPTLSPSEKLEVARLHLEKKVSKRKIAKRFGVHRSTISRILKPQLTPVASSTNAESQNTADTMRQHGD